MNLDSYAVHMECRGLNVYKALDSKWTMRGSL